MRQVDDSERVLFELPQNRIELRRLFVAGDQERRHRQVFERVQQRLSDREREMSGVRGVDERVDRIDHQASAADRLHVIQQLIDDGHHIRGAFHQLKVAIARIENGKLSTSH